MLRKIILSTAPKIPKYISLPFLGILFFALVYQIVTAGKIYPGVKIGNINLSFLTQDQAISAFKKIQTPETIELVYQERKFNYPLSQFKTTYNPEKTASRAYFIGRQGNIFERTVKQINVLIAGEEITLSYDLETKSLDQNIDELIKEFTIPSLDPEATISGKTINVSLGKNGQGVDREELVTRIYNTIALTKHAPIQIPVNQITPKITNIQAESIKIKAQKIIGKSLKITFEDQAFIYKDSDVLTLMHPLQEDFTLNKVKIQNLISEIAKTVNRDPQDAKLDFKDSQVREFLPGKDGIQVRQDELTTLTQDAIIKLLEAEEKEVIVQVPFTATKPEVSTGEVNNLGIKELVGRGESFYKGSIPSRIHNLSLAASRLNGTLIKPGEEFSFNRVVGEISQNTGYQQAFVIKEGKTILDDGGGVCQVSTTFFRTAINTGLPILERHQHSYRVSYYEQGTKLGLDAAIYQPGIDLRIKNDTPAHILILTKNDHKNFKLVFEFYGTSDGRVSEIKNIRTWDPVPAPPDLYQDDPTLPVGQVKQVEHSIPGIKAAFDYSVIRNGETLQKRTFSSNYRAWQAVYLRGTATQ